MHRQLEAVLFCASVLGSAPAAAVLVQVDLDAPGSLGFFVNPNPNYSVNAPFSVPVTYTPGDVLVVDVEFIDLDGSGGHGVGAAQYLRVSDLTQQIGADPDPAQDINAFLTGSIPAGPVLTGLAFQLQFTGVSGTISGTTFGGASPFCTASFCAAGVTGADLIQGPPGQDASFTYHDFHVSFSTDPNASILPFGFASLAFGGAADAVAVSSVPEPGTLALLAIGAVGMGLRSRRRATPIG